MFVDVKSGCMLSLYLGISRSDLLSDVPYQREHQFIVAQVTGVSGDFILDTAFFFRYSI